MRVYVDGENFRHGVASILRAKGVVQNSKDVTHFPLRQLLEDVTDAGDLTIAYYAAKIKMPRGYEPTAEVAERASEIRDFSRKWVADLAVQKIEYIKAGYLKVKKSEPCTQCGHKQEILQEKGVDVRIAVDLITDSHITTEKTIALMSSDSDLIPALDRIRKSGVRIIYICFANAVNRAMSATADETITIATRKVEQLYRDSL